MNEWTECKKKCTKSKNKININIITTMNSTEAREKCLTESVKKHHGRVLEVRRRKWKRGEISNQNILTEGE